MAVTVSSQRAGSLLQRKVQGVHSTLPFKAAASRSRVVTVKAEAAQAPVKPPSGVSVPSQLPQVPPPTFGFVNFAERINGRACMLGFIALLVIEGVSHKALLSMLGITIGQGLGFEL